MNKADLVEVIHEKIGGTKSSADDVMETLLSTIIATLKKEEEVSIAGLGIFSVKRRAARQARNPRTGALVQVPATKTPKFRPSKALKEAVKG